MRKKIKQLIAERQSKIANILERSAKRKFSKLKYWRETLSSAALSTLDPASRKSLKDKATRTR